MVIPTKISPITKSNRANPHHDKDVILLEFIKVKIAIIPPALVKEIYLTQCSIQ
jgi:hypothetical protein